MTISKIRFLESQGLVDPERTPSGYRKFYDQDVERLRWILRQQREHFLPLKVIRGRLTEHPEKAPGANGASEASEAGDGDEPAAGEAGDGDTAGAASAAPEKEERTAKPSPRREAPPTLPGLGEEPARAGRAPEPPARRPEPAGGTHAVETDSFTAEELATAAGATVGLVNELKQYGLLTVHATVAGTAYFDRSALAVTKAAAGFALHGVEARHLRAWRNSADREAALFEQLVMPLLRQRNPQARKQAAETVENLSRLGGELRSALLEKALRDIR